MNAARFFRAVGMAFCWTLLAAGVGLIQLWIVFWIHSFIPSVRFDLTAFVREGVLLFFAMAIVTTVTIDYFFSHNLDLPKWVVAVIFVLTPFVTAVFVASSYTALYIVDPNIIKYEDVSLMQLCAMALAMLYALVAKSICYYTTLN